MASHIERRKFLATLGGAAAWPVAVHAQQDERVRRVGVLLPAVADDPVWQTRFGAFLQGLQQSGWSIGRTCGLRPAGPRSMPPRFADTLS